MSSTKFSRIKLDFLIKGDGPLPKGMPSSLNSIKAQLHAPFPVSIPCDSQAISSRWWLRAQPSPASDSQAISSRWRLLGLLGELAAEDCWA